MNDMPAPTIVVEAFGNDEREIMLLVSTAAMLARNEARRWWRGNAHNAASNLFRGLRNLVFYDNLPTREARSAHVRKYTRGITGVEIDAAFRAKRGDVAATARRKADFIQKITNLLESIDRVYPLN